MSIKHKSILEMREFFKEKYSYWRHYTSKAYEQINWSYYDCDSWIKSTKLSDHGHTLVDKMLRAHIRVMTDPVLGTYYDYYWGFAQIYIFKQPNHMPYFAD